MKFTKPPLLLRLFVFRTISHIFKVLSSILEKTTYRRARDEVMWLALQLIGSFPALLNKETIAEAARLYNVRRNGEWRVASR